MINILSSAQLAVSFRIAYNTETTQKISNFNTKKIFVTQHLRVEMREKKNVPRCGSLKKEFILSVE